MQFIKLYHASIAAFLASGAWFLTIVGMFLPWVTVTVKICQFFICLPEIEIYSSHTTFLQLLIPINISQFLPNINQYLTSLIISTFFPMFNQYLTSLTRAAYVLLGSVMVLLLALCVFAVKSRGERPPHRISAAVSLLASLIGIAAAYGTAQTLTEVQQHVNGVHTALGSGFWTLCVGLVLIGCIMLVQLLLSLLTITRIPTKLQSTQTHTDYEQEE